jgi:hypothetical protein
MKETSIYIYMMMMKGKKKKEHAKWWRVGVRLPNLEC